MRILDISPTRWVPSSRLISLWSLINSWLACYLDILLTLTPFISPFGLSFGLGNTHLYMVYLFVDNWIPNHNCCTKISDCNLSFCLGIWHLIQNTYQHIPLSQYYLRWQPANAEKSKRSIEGLLLVKHPQWVFNQLCAISVI